MRILMLDKNHLTDRRIVLVCQSLRDRGHDLRILALTPSVGVAKQQPTGIETTYIDISGQDQDEVSVTNGVMPRPPHVTEALQPGFEDPRLESQRLHEIEQECRSRYSNQRIGTLMFFLRSPKTAVSRLSERNARIPGRLLLLAFFHLLHNHVKLIYKIPRSLYNACVARFRHREPELPAFDDWEHRAYKMASDWKPDIVVSNDLPTLNVGTRLKQELGVPLVYDAHELYSYQPHIGIDLAKQLFMLEKRLIAHVDHVMVINEQQSEIMARDLGGSHYTVLTNATDIPEGFDVDAKYDLIRDATGIAANDKIMLFQGGINNYRRIDYLLRGLAKSGSSHVHIAFLTFGGEIAYYEQMAQELNISDRIHMLPIVPWSEVVFWCASADCGVMPYQATDQNTTISNPNKLYEFLMAATPVIGSSELVNLEKIVSENNFGVTLPLRTDEDYASAIDRMFDESLGGADRFRPSLLKNRGKYTWASESQNMLKMYDGIVTRLEGNVGAVKSVEIAAAGA